jgi:hypothetical protein
MSNLFSYYFCGIPKVRKHARLAPAIYQSDWLVMGSWSVSYYSCWDRPTLATLSKIEVSHRFSLDYRIVTDYCKIAESRGISWFGTLSIPNELLMAILLGVGIGTKHSVKHIFFLLMNYLVYHLKEMQCLFLIIHCEYYLKKREQLEDLLLWLKVWHGGYLFWRRCQNLKKTTTWV